MRPLIIKAIILMPAIAMYLLDGCELVQGDVDLLVVRVLRALAPRAVEVGPLFLNIPNVRGKMKYFFRSQTPW